MRPSRCASRGRSAVLAVSAVVGVGESLILTGRFGAVPVPIVLAITAATGGLVWRVLAGDRPARWLTVLALAVGCAAGLAQVNAQELVASPTRLAELVGLSAVAALAALVLGTSRDVKAFQAYQRRKFRNAGSTRGSVLSHERAGRGIRRSTTKRTSAVETYDESAVSPNSAVA